MIYYNAEVLAEFFKTHRIATMPELKKALRTKVDLTVHRKLKELNYLSSYSHSGRYYTLRSIAEFDHHGLWRYGSVGFSKYGNLLQTAKAFVNSADSGYYADELQNVLQVNTGDALRKLAREGQLTRKILTKKSRKYLYCSADATTKREQLVSRRVQGAVQELITEPLEGEIVPDELKAAIILFFSLLDEKQRRIYAGLESFKRGHGGDSKIAELLGMDVGTVAKGRRQLLDGQVESGIRKHGGGRKRLEKKLQK